MTRLHVGALTASLLGLGAAATFVLGGCAPHKWHLFDGPRYRTMYEEVEQESRERTKRVESRTAEDVEYCRHEYVNFLTEATPFKGLMWDTPIRGEVLVRLTTQRDSVFAETESNKVYCLDAETGFVTWVFDPGVKLDFPPSTMAGLGAAAKQVKARLALAEANLKAEMSRPTKDQQRINSLTNEVAEAKRQLREMDDHDLVYCIGRSVLFCLDNKGNLLWKKLLKITPSTPILATASTLYCGALEWDRAYAFDSATGAVTGFFDTGAVLTAMPAYEDPALILASEDGGVYAYGNTGNISWLYRTERPIVCDMAIYEDMVYVGSTDYALYAISRITGGLKWKYESGGRITTAPSATKKTVFVKSEHNGFFGLDAANGKVKWRLPQGERVLVKGMNKVFILGNDHCIYGVNEDTGDVVTQFDPGIITLIAPNPTGDLFIGATKDGHIFGARESKTKF